MTEQEALAEAATQAARFHAPVGVWKHVGGMINGMRIYPQGRFVVTLEDGTPPRSVWAKVATVHPGDPAPEPSKAPEAPEDVAETMLADLDTHGWTKAVKDTVRDAIIQVIKHERQAKARRGE